MDMKDKILTSAQTLIQTRGVNGFSYADIANEVGIRKASLHYHFPTKTDLVKALIERYSDYVQSALVDINHAPLTAHEKLLRYFDLYRTSLNADKVCMGGMIGAEALTLDTVVMLPLKGFFNLQIKWLTAVLKEGVESQLFTLNNAPDEHANLLVSALQGALIVSRATQNPATFDATIDSLMSGLSNKN